MFFDLKTDQRTHVFAWFDGQEIRCGENPEIALGDYGGDAACVETPTGALFAVACTRAGLVGVLFAMQASVDPAEAIASGLRTGDLSERASARYERVVRQRYHNFRRFAVGFYDPALRKLWFARQTKLRFLACQGSDDWTWLK